jgi:hypothetical protein
MGLSWQQGPLAPGAADSDDVVIPHGPDRDLTTDEVAHRGGERLP